MWIINVTKICNINHIIFTKYIYTVSNKNVYTSYLIIINHFSSIEIYNIKLVLFVKVSSSLTTDSHKRFNKWWYVWCSMSINCTNEGDSRSLICGDSRYKCRLYPCEPFFIKEGPYIGRSVLLRYFYQHTNFFPYQKLIDFALHLFTN